MALIEPLPRADQLPFHDGQPTPDSTRLAEGALRYLHHLPPRPALGVCLCSSVAWGIATPVSDVDIGVIIPSDEEPHSEKLVFEGIYIDHCEWPQTWVEQATNDTLANRILSHTLAYSLILFDPDNWLAETQRSLRSCLEQPDTAQAWLERFLGEAEALQRGAAGACQEGSTDDIFPFLFEAVRNTANAALHGLPGGLCGEWPHRFREFSQRRSNEWFMTDAMTILSPLGIDLGGLAKTAAPLANLYTRSAASPRGSSMGCSAIHGEFLTRKVHHYLREQDPLSLLQVLRKQMGYIAENAAAKENRPDPNQEADAIRAGLREAAALIRQAVPHTPATQTASLQRLDQYIARARSILLNAPVPSTDKSP